MWGGGDGDYPRGAGDKLAGSGDAYRLFRQWVRAVFGSPRDAPSRTNTNA